MRRGQINPRSWDAAIRAVQNELRALAAESPRSDEQARILDAAVQRCEETKARKYLAWVSSNRELAAKYGISPRTVTNWRREGCPFGGSQRRVLGWMVRRRYVPAGARAKFGDELRKRRTRAFFTNGLQTIRAIVLNCKAHHRAAGVPVPDWTRGMPFRAR
jgi:hypothetical protein